MHCTECAVQFNYIYLLSKRFYPRTTENARGSASPAGFKGLVQGPRSEITALTPGFELATF